MNITYISQLDNITCDMLDGFFAGWREPLSCRQHLMVLRGSDHCVLALDEDKQVIGFITAVSDGVLSAYIPLLEILEPYQNMGIGSQLVRKMLAKLQHCRMIDVICDQEVVSFYEKFGFQQSNAMIIRR